MTPPAIIPATFDAAQIVADIAYLVTCESPSSDVAALRRSAEAVSALGVRYLGTPPEWVVIDGRPHLRWRLGSGDRPVLLLGHHDTVWPLGALADHPWCLESGTDGDIARGPGCFDMKTGLVQIFHALHALGPGIDATVLVTADEELGSPTSRELIETEARAARAALVLEASADGGAIKTERKGTAMYRVRVTGRAAHAGLEPEKGINAAIEVARQLLRITQIPHGEGGTTVVPTVLAAGTTTNTVPGTARLDVDSRARSVAEQQRVDAAMRALTPMSPGAALSVTGGPNRPPLESSMTAELFALAQRVAAQIGLGPLACAAVGGGSDGNFTGGVGTPTLDGLGAVGGGAHADSEHVVIAEIPRRTALLAGIVTELLRPA